MASSPLPARILRLALAALLVYFVLLGGTTAGELLPSLKIVDGLIAAGLIALLIWRMPARNDPMDRAALGGLLLFLGAALLSHFVRESLPAALAAFAYCGLFYAARRWFANPAYWQTFLVALRAMAIILVPLVCVSWGITVWYWLLAIGFRAPPPLDLAVRSFVWGHRHDLALLLVVITASYWAGTRGRPERALGWILSTLTALAVLLDGSRNLWLALALASVATLSITYGRVALRAARASVSRHRRVAAGLAAVALLLILLEGGALASRILTATTIGARQSLWVGSLHAWLIDPLSGLGPGSFPWDLQLTNYFQTNTYAPRHPDSAILQLLAETGALGILAVVAVTAGVVRTLRRHATDRTALWVVLVMLIACLGANPTDFGFLVVLLVLWASRVLPAIPEDGRVARRQASRTYRAVAAILALPVAAAFAATSFGAITYDSAANDIAAGELASARTALNRAVTLDPGMALYVRDRGLLALVNGHPRDAIPDLSRAVRLNPSDTVALRGLALAYEGSGNLPAAQEAAQNAVDRQASSFRNLVLLASIQAESGMSHAATNSLAEAVAIAPWVALTPAFGARVDAVASTRQVLDAAAVRWASGDSPVPHGAQATWLMALSGQQQYLGNAIAAFPRNAVAMQTLASVIRGQIAGASQQLRNAFGSEYDQPWYWLVRYAVAERSGASDPSATKMLRFFMPDVLGSHATDEPLLADSVTRFSSDRWGYRRVPLPIALLGPSVPSRNDALAQWLAGSLSTAGTLPPG